MGRKVCYFLWNAIDSILGTRSIRPKCISLSLSILEIAKWHEAYEYLCPIGETNCPMYRSTNQCRHPGCRTTWLHWVSPNLNGLADTGMLIVLCKFTFRSTAAFMFPAAHPTMLVDTDENWAYVVEYADIRMKKSRKRFIIINCFMRQIYRKSIY